MSTLIVHTPTDMTRFWNYHFRRWHHFTRQSKTCAKWRTITCIELCKWLDNMTLKLSAENSSATLSTKWNNEIYNTSNKNRWSSHTYFTKTQKIWRVTFDNMVIFSEHAWQVQGKIRKLNNVPKALADIAHGWKQGHRQTTTELCSAYMDHACYLHQLGYTLTNNKKHNTSYSHTGRHLIVH